MKQFISDKKKKNTVLLMSLPYKYQIFIIFFKIYNSNHIHATIFTASDNTITNSVRK